MATSAELRRFRLRNSTWMVGGGIIGPILQTLTSSVSSATVGAAMNATISSKTAGSVLSLTGAGAAGLSVSGSTISGTPTTVGEINVVETLAGATGSPKTTSALISVVAAAATVPAAMAAPTLTAGDGQISVARAAAPNDGGSPITSYDARRSTDGATWTTTTGLSASQVIAGLTNGTAYQIQTRAVNAVGAGAWSPTATATPAASALLFPKMPANARMGVMGDSLHAGSDTRNLAEIITLVSRSRLQATIGSRLAQGGRTMQQMLTEVLPGQDTQIGGAVKQKFDVVLFDGGTNDIAPGGGATPRTLDEMKADHQSIVDQLRAAGSIPLRGTIPRTGTVDDSTSKRQMFNAWLKTRNDLLLADLESIDPNDSTFIYTDKIHPKGNGVFAKYAPMYLAVLEPYFDSAYDATAVRSDNLDADCRITTTGGPGTIGTGIATDSLVATGWTAANASTATVRVDTIEGRMRVTGSGNASAVANITLTNSVPVSGNFTPGKNIGATQKARLARASQDAGPIGVRLLAGVMGTFAGFLSTTYDAVTGPITVIVDGVLQMVPKKWSGGGSPSVAETITIQVDAGAVDFVLDIGPGNAYLSEEVAYAVPALVPGRIEPSVAQAVSGSNTVITADFGAWYGGKYAFTFQHLKNGVAISGATGRTYTQATSGASGDYSCDITCTNALGANTFRTPAITVP